MIEGEYLTKILQNQLKNPVSGILSLAQLILLEGGANPDIRDYAQNIYERGQRVLTVLDNLVDLDLIENHLFSLKREPLVINTLVEQVQKEYERAMRLKGLTLRIKVQGLPWGTAPLLTFWGKENLIWGILQNVFRNALEAAPSGSAVDLRVDLTGEFLIVELDNEGEVPHELRERFFEPFLPSKPDGVGFGSYVVRAFCEAMDGDVSMATGDGRTSIRVTLPQREGKLAV